MALSLNKLKFWKKRQPVEKRKKIKEEKKQKKETVDEQEQEKIKERLRNLGYW